MTALVNIHLSSINNPSTPFAVTLTHCGKYFSHNILGKQLLHMDIPFNFAPKDSIEDYHWRIIIELKKLVRFLYSTIPTIIPYIFCRSNVKRIVVFLTVHTTDKGLLEHSCSGPDEEGSDSPKEVHLVMPYLMPLLYINIFYRSWPIYLTLPLHSFCNPSSPLSSWWFVVDLWVPIWENAWKC